MSQRREDNPIRPRPCFVDVSGGLALELIGGHRTQIAAVERVPQFGCNRRAPSPVFNNRQHVCSTDMRTNLLQRCAQRFEEENKWT